MKKIILLFLISMSINVFAQKELKEGVMTMKMSMSTDNEQAKAAFAMIGDIAVTTYFKGLKSRSEQSHQMTGDQISIVDKKSNTSLMLMNNPMLGKKYLKQDLNKSTEELENVSVTANGETKTVLNYNCKGYDIKTEQNGQELKMKMFVTDKILAQEQYGAMLGGKLKGFPMYMVVTVNQPGMGNMNITMEVTELKDEKVADSKFDMTIPEGYTEMEIPKPANVD
jgi:hypothetical protein